MQSDKYLKAKEYVEQLKHLKLHESYLLVRIESIGMQIGKITKANKKLPIQISDLTEYQKEMVEKQKVLSNEMRETRAKYESIVQAIESVPDQLCRTVLEHHYVNGDTWEDIAAMLNYSIRQIFRIRDKALLMIVIPN